MKCSLWNVPVFLFVINLLRHVHSIYVWHVTKQSKSLQTRYDTIYIYIFIYIYDRYYIRTHVYLFPFSVIKRVFELLRVWPWRWPRGGTPHMVFIGPVFHNTIKTCSKSVGHGGYEWVEKRNVSVCRGHELANYKYNRIHNIIFALNYAIRSSVLCAWSLGEPTEY